MAQEKTMNEITTYLTQNTGFSAEFILTYPVQQILETYEMVKRMKTAGFAGE